MSRPWVLALACGLMASRASALTLQAAPGVTITPAGAYSAGGRDGAVRLELAEVRTPGGAPRPEATWMAATPERFWVAEKSARPSGGVAAVQWADSRDCAALVDLAHTAPSPSDMAADATWMARALDSLAPCWSNAAPAMGE